MSEPPLLFDPDARRRRLDRAAAGFDRADFLHRAAAEAIAERLEAVRRAFSDVLIVGSGGGVFAEALRARPDVARIVQVEPSPRMAARARAFGETVETLEQVDGPFDLAVSGMALHAENDPVGALTRMRLALKPDGLMLAALFAGRSLEELRAALAEAEIAEEGGLSPRVAPMADLRDLGGLLQRAGFAMPVADLERSSVEYADPFALMRELRAMGEANALVGRRRGFTRRATLARAAAIYVAHYPGAEGRVRATAEVAYLTGWAPGPDQPTPKRPGSATARLADALGAEERPAGEKAGK